MTGGARPVVNTALLRAFAPVVGMRRARKNGGFWREARRIGFFGRKTHTKLGRQIGPWLCAGEFRNRPTDKDFSGNHKRLDFRKRECSRFFVSALTGRMVQMNDDESTELLRIAILGNPDERWALAERETLPREVQLVLAHDADEAVRAIFLQATEDCDYWSIRVMENRERKPAMIQLAAAQRHASRERKLLIRTAQYFQFEKLDQILEELSVGAEERAAIRADVREDKFVDETLGDAINRVSR